MDFAILERLAGCAVIVFLAMLVSLIVSVPLAIWKLIDLFW